MRSSIARASATRLGGAFRSSRCGPPLASEQTKPRFLHEVLLGEARRNYPSSKAEATVHARDGSNAIRLVFGSEAAASAAFEMWRASPSSTALLRVVKDRTGRVLAFIEELAKGSGALIQSGGTLFQAGSGTDKLVRLVRVMDTSIEVEQALLDLLADIGVESKIRAELARL